MALFSGIVFGFIVVSIIFKMTTMSILQAAPTGLALSLGWNVFPSKFPLHPAEWCFSLVLWSLQIYYPGGKTRIIFQSTFIDTICPVFDDRFNPKDSYIVGRELELAMTNNHGQRYINQKKSIATGAQPKEDYVDL